MMSTFSNSPHQNVRHPPTFWLIVFFRWTNPQDVDLEDGRINSNLQHHPFSLIQKQQNGLVERRFLPNTMLLQKRI